MYKHHTIPTIIDYLHIYYVESKPLVLHTHKASNNEPLLTVTALSKKSLI